MAAVVSYASTIEGQVSHIPAGSERFAGFVRLIPAIKRQVRFRFRHLQAEAAEEVLHEVLAFAFVAYSRLDSRGKEARAFATPLTRHAVSRIRQGRRFASPSHSRDVMSACRRVALETLDESVDQQPSVTGQWRELLLEDHRSTPAETAALRLDFSAWLDTLTPRDRHIADTLAMGETTGHVARLFRVSAARISQLRAEYHRSWLEFISERKTGDRFAMA
jgi:DNA-directed RNA polymerase specialized sigma24 family protein